MSTGTELAKTEAMVPQTWDAGAITKIEAVAKECGFGELMKLGQVERSFKLAAGIRMLKQHITDKMMADVMELMNTPLGFRTDRDPARDDKATPYPKTVVKECLIQSLLHGLFPVNNEWNIIAGQMYVALNGMKRLVEEFPGVSELRVTPQVYTPSSDGTSAFVPVTCSWLYRGELKEMNFVKSADADSRFIVRVNNRMGADAIAGKARRKAYAAIYQMLSSLEVPEGEVTDAQVPQLTSQASLPAPKKTLKDVAAKHSTSAKEAADLDEEDAKRTVQEATSGA